MWRNDAYSAPRRVRRGLVLAILAATCGAARAETDASDWSRGPTSAARLLSSGGMEDGAYAVGVEINMKPGAHTYWRSPGDAGVPPVFSFAGSRNLADARVRFPAPARVSEGGVDAFGYVGDLVFPIEATPVDPARPVVLALDLQYAVCEKICVPAQARATLELTPAARSGPHAARIAGWFTRAPAPSGSFGAPKIEITPLAGEKSAWRVAFAPPPPPGADLFAEAPDGWYFDTRREGDAFSLTLSQRPSDGGDAKVGVVLTYTAPAGAFEYNPSLDAGPPKP